MSKTKGKDKEPVYSFEDEHMEPEEDIDTRVERKLIEEEEKRKKTDDINIIDVAKNPPVPGYMKVELKKAVITTRDEDDKEVKVDALALPLDKKTDDVESPKDDPSIYKNCSGDSVQLFDTIMDIDLKQMAEGQISDCASTIIPMLMDEMVVLALDEKKARMPDKRKEEFKWWWVLVLAMIIIPIILITFTVLPGLFGGG